MKWLSLLLVAFAGCATLPPSSVLDADQARFKAMVGNDLAALDILLADDLVYVHSDAAVESKDQFLDELRSGRMRYRSISPRDVVVRRYGSTAVVTGRLDAAVTRAGADRDIALRYTAVYESDGGKWRLVSWQSTRVP
jgi:ketosteroid isomerase-like protein